uniref:Dynein heavy chain tail domain-containing protein n=1 Tax=Photinus pyralis TaxID=7054 RepID=A0A1Y1JU16_PHOPY
MKNPNLMHVCDILSYVQSTHVTQFMILIEDIHHSLREAKSNIEYLQVITQPCADLMEKQSPAEIPRNLVEILNLFRFIWEQSPFYNSRRKITALCRALSNQIILQCKKFTNLDVVFKEKHSRAAIIMFQTCIDCCVEYTRIYTAVSASHEYLYYHTDAY